MTVIRMHRKELSVAEFKNVTSISYASDTGVYTIVHSGGTSIFNNDTYFIQILAN